MPGAMTSPTALTWRCCGFDALSVVELESIYRARQLVFVIEQACAYLDADGVDSVSIHLAAHAPGEALPLAYARIVAPGKKYAEPSIGRVLTLGAGRGCGIGRELVRRAVVACELAYPATPIRISAQARLEAFYASFGFAPVGASYLEDGIPHVEMRRPG